MDRRNIFKTLLLACAPFPATAMASAAKADPGGPPAPVPKVAYHLADLEKVGFVLGNIRRHLEGMGGPDKVKLTLVVHGNSLWAFRAETPNLALKQEVRDMVSANVELQACVHTMERMKLRLEDLLPGFAVAEKGAGIKLVELQGQGFAYLRP
jgi:intracellular sulfur oxidation DsrE/DsrF family protein